MERYLKPKKKDKLRDEIDKDAEDTFEIDDSDLPVHEKFVKEKKLRKLRNGLQ